MRGRCPPIVQTEIMYEFFFGSGTGHSFMLLSVVIALGLLLGKVKIKGISLGSSWVLFVGILLSALGMKADPRLIHFIKEFGLILFVFALGLQVGPAFVNSFKKGGGKMTLFTIGMVLVTVLITLGIAWTGGEELPTLVGIMTGAVTCTPGLGTAQQSFFDLQFGTFLSETEVSDLASSIAAGYAVAYPIGILGVIGAIVLLEKIFRVDIGRERAEFEKEARGGDESVEVTLSVSNPAVTGCNPNVVLRQFDGAFAVSKVIRDGHAFPPDDQTLLQPGDRLCIVAPARDIATARMVFGAVEDIAEDSLDEDMPTARILVSNTSLGGRKLRDLKLRENYGVTLTTVIRANVEIVANRDLALQVGDTVIAVGPQDGLNGLSKELGNSVSRLERPNLIPVFIGIALGLTLGYIPFRFGGMHHPFRLGLAAGPLIVAILLGYFGPRWKVTTYNTNSAYLMLRELGICLLLAAIGLGAGETFVDTVLEGGWRWLLYAALIVVVPVLITGLVARLVFKMNFYHICGLLAGTTTSPQALSFAQGRYGTFGYISTAYSAVYPVALFLWIVVAQVLMMLYYI